MLAVRMDADVSSYKSTVDIGGNDQTRFVFDHRDFLQTPWK